MSATPCVRSIGGSEPCEEAEDSLLEVGSFDVAALWACPEAAEHTQNMTLRAEADSVVHGTGIGICYLGTEAIEAVPASMEGSLAAFAAEACVSSGGRILVLGF